MIGDKISQLHNSKVIVFGIGGVGGYATEILARSGVGNITLVDYDRVDITNKNRQIIALDSTIGKFKVDVMKDFNLQDYDYIVDAIDMIESKVSLITFAHENNIPIISAMGAGNRLGIPNVVITDIYKTHDDGLAKVLRKKLRERNISSHNVVFCANNTNIANKTIGSIAYFPAICGCMLGAHVVEELIKER